MVLPSKRIILKLGLSPSKDEATEGSSSLLKRMEPVYDIVNLLYPKKRQITTIYKRVFTNTYKKNVVNLLYLRKKTFYKKLFTKCL